MSTVYVKRCFTFRVTVLYRTYVSAHSNYDEMFASFIYSFTHCEKENTESWLIVIVNKRVRDTQSLRSLSVNK